MSHNPHDELARAGIRALLQSVNEDPEREGLVDTPDRFLRAFKELTVGYTQNASEILSTVFEQETYDEMVILRKIPFQSLCEHHLQIYSGHATVAYVPKGRVVGLSKLARLVDCYAYRLTIQENLTQQIAMSIMKYLEPLGAACVMAGSHGCMCYRGVKKGGAEMVTSCLLGSFKDNPTCRAEFLQLSK